MKSVPSCKKTKLMSVGCLRISGKGIQQIILLLVLLIWALFLEGCIPWEYSKQRDFLDHLLRPSCPTPTPQVIIKKVYVQPVQPSSTATQGGSFYAASKPKTAITIAVPKPQPTLTPSPTLPLINTEEAITKYRNFEYTQCLRLLKHILASSSSNQQGYLDALLYAGACAYMLTQEDLAQEFFQQARQIDPNCYLDETEFIPEMVQFFERVDALH